MCTKNSPHADRSLLERMGTTAMPDAHTLSLPGQPVSTSPLSASTRRREYRAWTLRWLLRALSWLPLRANHALGAAAGRLAGRLPNSLRHTARINIDLCFPDRDRRARFALVRATLEECGRAAAEFGPLCYWSRARIASLVREVRGAGYLRQAAGQGRVLITPHLGAWELAALFAALSGPVTILYRPSPGLALERFVRAARGRFGATLRVLDRGGLRQALRVLQGGGTIGLAPDQDPGPDSGVFAPLFGVAARTGTLVGALAKRGYPVVAGVARRLPAGRGFQIRFHPAPPGLADADPRVAALALNRLLERLVHDIPEQYQWCYKRFRTRPAGEPPLY